MLPFKDIFIVQVIGLLVNRQFSGDGNFLLGTLPAKLQFKEGRLTNARYGGFIKAEALKKMLWVNQGEIAFETKPYPEGDWNYAEDINKAIAEFSQPMLENCPFMKHLSLERGKLKPQQKSEFMISGMTVFSHLQQSVSISKAQGNLSAQEFWKALLYMTSSGQIIGSYSKLSALLIKTQNGIVNNLQKLLGKRAVQTYEDYLAKNLTAHWSNWRKDKTYDPLYGTAPYKTWAKLLGETVSQVISSGMGISCYKQALTALTNEESNLFQELIK